MTKARDLALKALSGRIRLYIYFPRSHDTLILAGLYLVDKGVGKLQSVGGNAWRISFPNENLESITFYVERGE
jgi:hypothetical protein